MVVAPVCPRAPSCDFSAVSVSFYLSFLFYMFFSLDTCFLSLRTGNSSSFPDVFDPVIFFFFSPSFSCAFVTSGSFVADLETA